MWFLTYGFEIIKVEGISDNQRLFESIKLRQLLLLMSIKS